MIHSEFGEVRKKAHFANDLCCIKEMAGYYEKKGNIIRSIYWHKQASKQGDKVSARRLQEWESERWKMLLFGKHLLEDQTIDSYYTMATDSDDWNAFVRSREWAVALKDRVSQNQLWEHYLFGEGTQRDEEAALRWLRESAKIGFPKACYWLSHYFLQGRKWYLGANCDWSFTRGEDWEEGMYWLRVCAEKGSERCSTEFTRKAKAELRIYDIQSQMNQQLADLWLVRFTHYSDEELEQVREALARPDSLKLGEKRSDSEEVLEKLHSMDEDEFKELFTRAHSGDPDAAFMAGVYCESVGMLDTSSFWLRKAAEGGHPLAKAKLSGEPLEPHPDLKEAFLHFLSEGRLTIRVDQEGVDDIETNRSALKEFQKNLHLAKEGNLEAMMQVSLDYSTGDVVPKGEEQALFWLQSAARGGSAQAQYELGSVEYMFVDETNELSVCWLSQAAEQQHPDAMYDLGIMYFEGRGVDEDRERALDLWKKAAALGNANAAAQVRKLCLREPNLELIKK